MDKIIKEIKDSLLSGDTLSYIENYPIKIVHDQNRVKDDAALAALNEIEFFDQNGFSNATHSEKTINFLHANAPEYIQSVSFGVSSKTSYSGFTFSEKYPGDRWKKVVEDEDLQAIIEISNFSSFDDYPAIETELRDIMRSRKEVPLLKKTGFIWIANVAKDHDISNIMRHYFVEKYTSLEVDEKTVFIGWNQQLQNINMRYFVNPPNSQKQL
ncbi:MAG: hypothetical protein ABXS93_00040 [Sulfurimonas sp.]